MNYQIDIERMIPYFLGGALIFYQLSQANVKTLIVIGLILVYVIGVVYYHQTSAAKDANVVEKREQKIQAAIEPNQVAQSSHYGIKRFPRNGKLKYLPENTALMEICEDLMFTRTFDKARYADLLLHMDKFQKTYMYLLGDRLVCTDGIPTLLDYRANILELIQSMIHIVPRTMKHTYGLSPFEVIEKNVERFLAVTRVMLQVVEGYCKTPIPYTQPYNG